MRHGPPGCDEPDVSVASYPGAKFPSAELVSDFSKTGNDLIHVGTPRRIFVDHIGNKWLQKLETMVFLVCGRSGHFCDIKKERKNKSDLHIIFSNQVS